MRARILLSLLVLLAACGQTGPLYLPDEGIDSDIEIRPAPPASPEEPADAEEDGQGSPVPGK